MTADDDHAQLAADWYGLHPADARPCPRVVVGNRCLADTHPAINADGAEVAVLLRDLDTLGLAVAFDGCPPGTRARRS